MNKGFIILLCSLLAPAAFAQNTQSKKVDIIIQVMDTNANPIPDAVINLQNLATNIRTNSKGTATYSCEYEKIKNGIQIIIPPFNYFGAYRNEVKWEQHKIILIELKLIKGAKFDVRLKNESGGILHNASISCKELPNAKITTSDGVYSIPITKAVDSLSLSIRRKGYLDFDTTFIEPHKNSFYTEHEIILKREPGKIRVGILPYRQKQHTDRQHLLNKKITYYINNDDTLTEKGQWSKLFEPKEKGKNYTILAEVRRSSRLKADLISFRLKNDTLIKVVFNIKPLPFDTHKNRFFFSATWMFARNFSSITSDLSPQDVYLFGGYLRTVKRHAWRVGVEGSRIHINMNRSYTTLPNTDSQIHSTTQESYQAGVRADVYPFFFKLSSALAPPYIGFSAVAAIHEPQLKGWAKMGISLIVGDQLKFPVNKPDNRYHVSVGFEVRFQRMWISDEILEFNYWGNALSKVKNRDIYRLSFGITLGIQWKG